MSRGEIMVGQDGKILRRHDGIAVKRRYDDVLMQNAGRVNKFGHGFSRSERLIGPFTRQFSGDIGRVYDGDEFGKHAPKLLFKAARGRYCLLTGALLAAEHEHHPIPGIGIGGDCLQAEAHHFVGFLIKGQDNEVVDVLPVVSVKF